MDVRSHNSHDHADGHRAERYDRFVALLARHDESIRRFIRAVLPSREGVDDVMQETALECWKKFDSFSPASEDDAAGEFIRWACVIARYKALSWQRDRSRDRLVFRESVLEQLADTAIDRLEQYELERRAIERCLDKLPVDQKRLLLSVHTPGESVARIAAETGEKARRLYNRINALRRQLLDCVRRQLADQVSHG